MPPLAVRGGVIAGLASLVALVFGLVLSELNLTTIAAVGLAAGLVAAGAFAGFAALRAPGVSIRDVGAAANELATGDLSRRVEATSGPTSELTSNFNGMAGRLEELFDTVVAEHARLEAVFDAARDAMIAVAGDTTVRFLNPAAEAILQVGRDAVVGRPLIESARDFELDGLVRMAAGAESSGDTRIITFGARRMPLRAVAVPIRDGGDWAVLLVLNDLTEVQRVDAMRRDFVGNVSHELRTPLAAIKALVESMEAGFVDDPEDQQEFLGRIRKQVDRLTLLVNELLDLSRIESGAIELHPEIVDLCLLAKEAAMLLSPRAEAAGVVISPPADGPCEVEGDRASLLRIISNLLDNAIKYSPPGGMIRMEAGSDGRLATLAVTDDGPGIASHDLPRVFERFYKGDASRATEGVGLGLAIVKHLVRAHGGMADVASPPGQGATFTVHLPTEFVGTRPSPVRKSA